MEDNKLKLLEDLAKQFNDNGFIESLNFEDLEVMNWAVEQVKKTFRYQKALERISKEDVFGITTQTIIAKEVLNS